ncbi:hypothetical protein C8R43DRAFT_1163100, partial [Mycena crocata]
GRLDPAQDDDVRLHLGSAPAQRRRYLPPNTCSTTSAARSAAPQSFIQVLDFRRARLHCTSRIQAWLRAADPQISIPFLEFIQYKDCALDHDPGGAQRRHANYSSTLSSMLYRSTPRDRAARSAASKWFVGYSGFRRAARRVQDSQVFILQRPSVLIYFQST